MAGNSGAIRAGRAFIELFAKDDKLKKDLDKTRANLSGWGASINKVGNWMGQGISQAFGLIAKGGKIAGIAVAGIGAGLIAGAHSFAEANRAFMTSNQGASADRMRESFALLGDSAVALRNTFFSGLQPAFSSVIDIARIGMNTFRQWLTTHQELITGINNFVGGLRDALSSGDIKLAGEILWAGLKVVWTQGIAALMPGWVDFKNQFQEVAVEAVFGVQLLFQNLWAELKRDAKKGWADTMEQLEPIHNFLAETMIQLGIVGGDQKLEDLLQASREERAGKALQNGKPQQQAQVEFEKEVNEFTEKIGDALRAAKEVEIPGLKADNANALQDAANAAKEALENLRRMQGVAKAGANPIGLDIPKAREAAARVIGTFSSQSLEQLGGSGSSIPQKSLEAQKAIQKLQKDSLDTLKIIAGKLVPGVAPVYGP